MGGGGRDHNLIILLTILILLCNICINFLFVFCFNHCPLGLSKDGHVTLDLQHGQQSQSSAVHMTAKQALSRLISTNSEHIYICINTLLVQLQ